MGWPHGLFSWADVSADDPAASEAFYAGVFGWEVAREHDAEGNHIYTRFQQDGKNVAGLGPKPPDMAGVPSSWSSYVHVDSVDAVVAAAESAGGSVMMPAMDVMDYGRMAFITDPTGATVGLWEPNSFAGGDTFLGPNTLSWNELATRDPDAAIGFYSETFPWRIQKMEMPDPSMHYWTIHLDSKVDGDGDMDDDFNGGLLAMNEDWPADMPAHWMVYIRVADTDATIAALTELDGSVAVPAFDTQAGRIAVVRDPEGATFSIIDA